MSEYFDIKTLNRKKLGKQGMKNRERETENAKEKLKKL